MNYDTEKLLNIKRRLDNACVTLNEEIVRFEDELARICMGVPVWLGTSSDKIVLGYGKWQGKWRVIVRYHNSDGEEITNALVEAPRNVRLYGYKHRMELLPAIEKAAESLANRIEKVVAGDSTED